MKGCSDFFLPMRTGIEKRFDFYQNLDLTEVYDVKSTNPKNSY